MATPTMPPATGSGNPLPCTFSSIATIALRVDHDAELGLVIVSCAAEPGVRVLMAPEVALDLALRLTGVVAALRRQEGGR